MRIRLEKKLPLAAPPRPREQVRAQLAQAAGVSARARKDPVSFVTESFYQSFDRLGAQRTAERLPGGEEREAAARDGTEAYDAAQAHNTAEANAPAAGALRGETPKVAPELAAPLQKFSETAFQRGKLSASVLRGTGKMMLVSCLKRTVGQSDLERSEEQDRFQSGAQQRNVPGHSPDSVVFTRGVAQSAVGLVVDTLRDARRTVQSMEALASGAGEVRGGVEGSTLRAMYPFLDDSRERALLAEYGGRLRACADAEERAVLQNALVHTHALIEKKAQMKAEFINKLRLVSDRAAETLAELEAPGAAEEIAAAVLAPEEDEPSAPPEDDGEDDHGAGDRAGEFPAEDLPGTGADAPGAAGTDI